ncbi:MAG: restriction endonuclease subunit S, partial [Desulfuromonadales bacterium]|nr:restriction endonuclease subunit S [Desulfuromonadales bacterium]
AVEGTIVDQDNSTWEVTSLGAVATTIRNGFSVKPDAEAGTRIFRISAVRPLRLDLDEVRYLSGEIVDYSPSVVLAGDVLFTRYNGNPELVGVCAVVPENCPETVHPDKLIRVVTPREILIPEMLALLASAGEGRSFIKSKTRTTAGQAGISGGDLKALPIKIPPLKIQHQIVAEVERRLSIVAEAEAQVDANLRRADRLRQSILKQAFSGQLVPQDENDEPASEILERIRNDVRANNHSPQTVLKTQKRAQKRANINSPLRKKPLPSVAETTATYGDAIASRILAAMQPDREYARADLADPLGLTTGQWNVAIQGLKRAGMVRQVGEKRGRGMNWSEQKEGEDDNRKEYWRGSCSLSGRRRQGFD